MSGGYTSHQKSQNGFLGKGVENEPMGTKEL
jgi:hypothetical protein